MKGREKEREIEKEKTKLGKFSPKMIHKKTKKEREAKKEMRGGGGDI